MFSSVDKIKAFLLHQNNQMNFYDSHYHHHHHSFNFVIPLALGQVKYI